MREPCHHHVPFFSRELPLKKGTRVEYIKERETVQQQEEFCLRLAEPRQLISFALGNKPCEVYSNANPTAELHLESAIRKKTSNSSFTYATERHDKRIKHRSERGRAEANDQRGNR